MPCPSTPCVIAQAQHRGNLTELSEQTQHGFSKFSSIDTEYNAQQGSADVQAASEAASRAQAAVPEQTQRAEAVYDQVRRLEGNRCS